MTTDNCVFLVVQQGFGARYLLRTGIIQNLTAQGIKIVILTPNVDEAYFQEEFRCDNIIVEKFETEKCTAFLKRKKGQRIFKNIRGFVLDHKADLKSVKDRYRIFLEEIDGKSLVEKLILRMIHFIIVLLRFSRLLRRILLWVESFLYQPDFHSHLFRRYRPSLVVTTSLGNVGNGHDFFIMREARKFGAKTLAVILSWDNPTAKGLGGAVPDAVICWTAQMKQEMIQYHSFPADKIKVCGIAHFDIYQKKNQFIPKDILFEKLRLAPDKKLLFFGTKSPTNYPWNTEIIETLAQAIAEGQFETPCQLLVRVHPIHYDCHNGDYRHARTLDEYKLIQKKYPFVVFHSPKILSKSLSFDMPASDMVELASLLECTGVLINIFSTLTLEGALLDVPIVNVFFEGNQRKKTSPRHSIEIDSNQVHNQRVVKTGGLRLATSPNQMIEQINKYLIDPTLDSEGRSRIREQECGPHKGYASEEIAKEILCLVQNS